MGALFTSGRRPFAIVGIAVWLMLAVGPAFGQPAPHRLSVPANGKIPVAFVVSEGSEFIDFAGPWAVFQAVLFPSRGASMDDMQAFRLYTVSDSRKPIRVSGGMQIIPDYTFADAPEPKVVVVPAVVDSPAMSDWIRTMSKRSDVVMSVCLGAVELAKAGLLSGKKAASFDGSYIGLQRRFPDVQFVRNMRYVQSDRTIFTSGALSAGIDLAIHVVELYFGRDVSAATARGLNYEGRGWAGDGSSTLKSPLPSDGLSTGVSGNWRGDVVTKQGPLQLAVHIWPDPNGKRLDGFAEILNKGAETLFIDPIAFNDPNVHFEIHTVAGTYDGKLNAQGTAIEGTWKQSGTSAPLVITRVEQ